MKTTIDLPEELVHRLKMRAAREKRKLKDLAADYIQAGLSNAAHTRTLREPVISISKVTGFPVIESEGPTPQAAEMTPERIKDILLEQEIEWAREATRH